MPCKCGGCFERGGEAIPADGGGTEAAVEIRELTVEPPDEDPVTCTGPVDRLEEAATALLELRFGDVVHAMSRGRVDRPVRCWPLWLWLLAALWLVRVRS
ncbi:MAG: hypothetical protein ACOC83_06530 [Gemmatimonadota bacterium]